MEKLPSMPWAEVAVVVSGVALAAICAAIGGILFGYQIYSPVLPSILWGAGGAIIACDIVFLLCKCVAKIAKKPVSDQEKSGESSSSAPAGDNEKGKSSASSTGSGSRSLQVGGIQSNWEEFEAKSRFSANLWRSVRRIPENKVEWKRLITSFNEASNHFEKFFRKNSLSSYLTSYKQLQSALKVGNPLDVTIGNDLKNLRMLMEAIEYPQFKGFMDRLYEITMSNEPQISNRSESLQSAIRFMREYRYRRDPNLEESQKSTGLTGVAEDSFRWIVTTYFHVIAIDDVTTLHALSAFSFPAGDPLSQSGNTLITKICGTGGHFTNYVNGHGHSGSGSAGSCPIFLDNARFVAAQKKIDWQSFCRPKQDQNNCFLVSSWVNFAVFLRYLKALDIDASQLMSAKVS